MKFLKNLGRTLSKNELRAINGGFGTSCDTDIECIGIDERIFHVVDPGEGGVSCVNGHCAIH